jgi:uncharacterized protein involved in tellurium resistance
MELVQQGASAQLGAIKQFMVSLKWTSEMDFDLSAAYQARDGKKGLVYFGDLGNLNDFPNMQLSGDEGVGVGDTGGDNEETMRVMSLDAIEYVWLLCWDWCAISDGTAARFKDSGVTVSLTDDTGTIHEVAVDTGDTGNVCVMATIDNSSPMGPKFVNTSKVGTLKGLKSLDQLVAIIDS